MVGHCCVQRSAQSKRLTAMRASECRLATVELEALEGCDTLHKYTTPCHTPGCIGHFTKCRGSVLPPAQLVQVGDRPDAAGAAVLRRLAGESTDDQYREELRST